MMTTSDDGPTRIATVDPLTGELLDENPLVAQYDTADDKTVILSDAKAPSTPMEKRAEFTPIAGRCDASDGTVVWKKKSVVSAEALLRCLRVLVDNAKGGRIALWVLLLIGASVVAVRGFGIPSPASTARRLEVTPASAERSETKPSVPGPSLPLVRQEVGRAQNTAPPMTPLWPIINGRVRGPKLADAAEALVNGRLDIALGIYKELSILDPTNPANRMAVEILERRARGDSR